MVRLITREIEAPKIISDKIFVAIRKASMKTDLWGQERMKGCSTYYG
jgi:hypothetical protein